MHEIDEPTPGKWRLAKTSATFAGLSELSIVTDHPDEEPMMVSVWKGTHADAEYVVAAVNAMKAAQL